MKQVFLSTSFLLMTIVGFAFPVFSGDVVSYPGWEKDGIYDQLYNVAEFDRLKGTVIRVVEVTPMPGMAKGVGLLVVDSDGEQVMVHLAPADFLDSRQTGLRKNDKVKVKGVWVEIDGKEAFMASKVKRGEHYELKVRRTRDGVAFWTLTPEELAKERAGE